MQQFKPVEFPAGIGHELYIKPEQGTIGKCNEREGVHLNDIAVYQGEDHFDADHEEPGCHEAIGSCIWLLCRNQQTCKEGL